MEQIVPLANGKYFIGRNDGQPLMRLVRISDCLITRGTNLSMYPLLPYNIHGKSEENPYRIMQKLIHQVDYSKIEQKNGSRSVIEATVNMDLCHITLYDHLYNINYLLIKEKKFVSKYSHLHNKIAHNMNTRFEFLQKNHIKIPMSTKVLNYIDNDELYDSDQEYMEKHQKKPSDYGFKKISNKLWAEPAGGFTKNITNIMRGDEKKAQCLENEIAAQNVLVSNMNLQLNICRNTDYFIQNMVQHCSHLVLHVELAGIYPKIYRKIRVPARLSLRVLHEKVLSVIFGYKRNFHSYLFLKPHRKNKKISFGPTTVVSSDSIHRLPIQELCMDDRGAYLFDFFKQKGDQLRYIYDLGDQYRHTIILESVTSNNSPFIKQLHGIEQHNIVPTRIRWKYEPKPLIEIIEGKRNGPPENMRGNRGYVRRLNVLQHGIDVSELQDRPIWEKENLECVNVVFDIIHSPNVNRKLFDTEKFDIKECQDKIKHVFSKPLIKNDIRNFVHPDRESPVIHNDKQYSQLLRHIRSKNSMGVRGVRICYYVNCRKKKYKMKCCKGCKNVFYCNKQCQKRDWKISHSTFCFNSDHF